MTYEWHTCQMQFKRVEFSELVLGQNVWHNIIGSSDRWLNGPFVVGDGVIINTSGAVIPVSYFGPDIIWYVPAPAHGAEGLVNE